MSEIGSAKGATKNWMEDERGAMRKTITRRRLPHMTSPKMWTTVASSTTRAAIAWRQLHRHMRSKTRGHFSLFVSQRTMRSCMVQSKSDDTHCETRLTNRGAAAMKSQQKQIDYEVKKMMARPERFERPTLRFVV